MQSKSIHEPFIRVVKRGEMPMKKKIAIRLFAVLLALVADALFIFFVTGLNPIDVYKAMIQGTFSTSMRFSWAMRDLASLLLIGIALAPAFKMRFWNTGAEGQVLMGALATAAVTTPSVVTDTLFDTWYAGLIGFDMPTDTYFAIKTGDTL